MEDSQIRSGISDTLAADAKIQEATLRNNFVQASESTPDEFARLKSLSSSSGVPLPHLLANPDVARQQRALSDTDFSGLVAKSPLTTSFLTDPVNARISRDDTASLSTMEQVLHSANYFGGSLIAGAHDAVGAGAKLVSTVLPTTSDQDLATLYKNDPEGLKRMRETSLATSLDRFARKQTARAEKTMEGVTPEAKALFGSLEYATTDTDKAAYLSPVKVVSDAVRSLPTTAALLLTALFTRGAASKAEAQAVAKGMTAAEAKTAATDAAVKMASRFGAASEGSVGYAQQALSTQQQNEKTSFETLEKAPAYQELIAQGFDPAAARIYLAAKAGEIAGAGAGAADAITNFFGGKLLGKILTEGGGTAARIGKGALNEALVEGVQSPFEQWFQNAATQALTDPSQDLSTGLLESTIQGFMVGGLTGGAFAGALGRARGEERATSGAQSISALFAAAADSLTGKRSPDTLRAALDHMAPDGSVFIDPAKLVDVLSQTGVDISALPTAAKQAAAGELAGAGIEIPISELVTGLMGTPAEKEIIKHLRMAPDLPTLGEVDEFNSTAAAFFQTEADRILEAEAKNEAFTEGAQAVHDDLFTQLTAVGRHGPQVNTSYAKLGSAFYSVLAHDLGITPVQVRDGWTDAAGTAHKGYRLKIGGEPGKAASLNQGFDHGQAMLNVGLDVGATDRAQKIDAAFVEAELNKMGVQVLSGKNVDGEYELDGQKVKELTYVPHLSRPLTEAEVNQLAAATGQEAIPQYVNGQGNLWGPNAAAWGDFNPEFFKDQAGATLASAQSGVKQIETTAFKKWFGDWQDPKAFSSRYPKDKTPVSQAVNAAGLPMTLYHATNGDFDTFETGRPSITSTTFGDIETNRHAIFVSPDSAFAEEYLRKGSGQNVMPVYLDVKAPMDLRNNKAWDYVDELNNNGFEGTRWPNLPDTRMWEMFDDETGVAFVAAAKKAGYDGAIMYESSAGDKMVEVWVAFDPTQVKSAIGNSGAFDPNDPNVLHQNFRTVSQGTIEAYRQDVAWTTEGMENGFPVWASQHVALAAPRDVTDGHDVFYMPLAGERAVKYDIRTPDGKTVGYTVLEIVDGWPVKLLDIETQKAERGNRYAEYTVAAIANDVGELAIWHIVPEARSWWDRQGTAPVDEYNGALTFAEYADARASRDNPQGVGDDVVFHQSQSTRRPTTKRAPEDHLGEVPLTVDYTKIEPEKTAQNMALVAKYPGLRFKARDAAKRAEEFIQHVTDNLLWLHDQIPADIRSRSKLWYDGARRITERWSAKYGKTDAQIAAVLAVYSPQKDWFMNVSLAERTLDIVSAQQQTPWSPEMTKVAGEILAKAEFKVLHTRIKGKMLAELTDKLDQAAWVRVYDEAHNNRGHRLVTPEGGLGEYTQAGAGKKRRDAKTGWPGFATIIKALHVIEDGSAATIDSALGGEHKVRSFYNNIFHPNSDRGFVTIDTHAVAAGLLRPLSGESIEVKHNFGSAGAGQSAKTGMSGTYPYYQEAYRRAAEARGLLPREMQSITWEAVRELYTMGFKHDKAKLTALDTIWTSYEKGKPIPRIEDGKITEGTEGGADRAGDLAAVRRSILALAGGVERPAWYQRDSGLSPDGWASTYTTELLGRSAPGADGRGARSGNRGGASGSVSEVLNQSAPVVRAGVVSAPVVGVHFSRQPRAALSSGMFGTGLKGAEAERLARSNDDRIKQRIAFYIDAGTGVHPEAGVGGAAHVSTLTNLYDADADTLKLFRRNQRDLNAAESAVVDAGFDGYLQRKNFHNQGTAVLLGARSQGAEHVGAVEDANARATVPPPAEIPAMKTLAIQLVNDRTLPGGAMLPGEWREYLMRLDSPLVSKIDFDQFNPDERIYKDQLAGALWQSSSAKQQTESPQFKKWFGDSKVIDESGAPLVVYHGTALSGYVDSTNIEAFDPSKTGDRWNADSRGFFFSNDKRIANYYATSERDSSFDKARVGEGEGAIYPVYVSLQNPLRLVVPKAEDIVSYWDSNAESLQRRATDGGHDGVILIDRTQIVDGNPAQTVVAFDPTQIKSAIGNNGAFDPNKPNILFQPSQEAPKLGSFSPQTLDMRILAGADYSTFVHELGHFFLTAYADVAAQPGAPQRVVDNMAAVLKQFGIADLATWHAMSLEEQRPYHEQLAESFEQYIFTGKAPSTELQPLFATLAAWMKRVYQSVKEFVAGHSGAKLNPELAAVFDRMLATDAEIESANAARGYAAMFANAADAGMSDKDFAAYTALTEAQREDAEAMLRTRSMRDMKWLEARRNKLIAAMQADAKEKRAEMRKEVSAEVRAEPLRQVERYLKHGVILSDSGSDIAPLGPNKLQISEVKLLFPEEALTPQPDLAKLGYGKYGMLVEVGLSPAEVAERFGLPSGIDLVNDLLGLTKLNDEIETRTDVAMLEKYGDLSSPEAMARAADEAIHNDFRTRAVATELSALAKNIGPASILMKAAKEYARQVLDTKTSRTLKPWSYAAAETRAGKAALAALRKGDRQLAATEKRTELVNHVTAKESYAVEKEIKAIVAKFKKLAAYNDASSAVKSRDFATVQAVRALLADHGIGSKGVSAAEYLATVKEQDPAAAARIEELVSVTGEEPKHWSEITVENLRSFAEAVDDIWFAAARTRQIEIQGKMVSQAGVAAELLATLEEQGIPARVPGEGWAPTPTEKLAMKFGALKAQWQRMEFIASKLDGNRAVGPWLKNVIGVVQDALSQMALVKASVLDQYKALLDTVSPTFVRGEIAAPELGYIFGRGPSGSGMIELLHAILHTGNESNMRKLLLGRKWATEHQDGSLDTSKWDAFVARMIAEKRITKVHYDFAQGVWNLMESLAPAAQKAHRAVFGKFFAKVTATPFENAFGKYAGGYVPALTDTDIVKDREVEKLRDAATSEMGVAFPEPPKGFTNKRVEGYTRELKLDLSALSGHINQVLLFSHMAVPVADIRRLLARPEIAGAVNRLYPGMIVEAINPWLVRVARNTVSPLATDMTRFLRAGRSRAGTNTMMGSVSNAVQQITGIIPATVAIDGTYLRHALVHNLTSPLDTAEFVKGKSTYMRTRIDTEAYAAADNVEQILVNPTVYQSTVDWTRRHAYFLQSAVDAALSPTIWIAAYNQALDKNPGMSDADAIHIADSLIRKTQGATGSADIATFEAGHPFIQLFTQFTGYFNMMAQFLHGEFVKNMAAEIGLPKKYARAFYIVTVGFYAQAVAAELIAQLFRGGPGDEDKDGELIDDWLFQLGVMAPVKFLTAAVPFLGSALITAGNKWNSKPYDDKMMNSPAISALEGALGAPVDVYKALYENGKPSKAVRSVAGALGLFGLPTAVLARPVGYLADVQTGHVAPTSGLDAIRGTITGTASPESKR